jgi:hypothetical protein
VVGLEPAIAPAAHLSRAKRLPRADEEIMSWAVTSFFTLRWFPGYIGIFLRGELAYCFVDLA